MTSEVKGPRSLECGSDLRAWELAIASGLARRLLNKANKDPVGFIKIFTIAHFINFSQLLNLFILLPGQIFIIAYFSKLGSPGCETSFPLGSGKKRGYLQGHDEEANSCPAFSYCFFLFTLPVLESQSQIGEPPEMRQSMRSSGIRVFVLS